MKTLFRLLGLLLVVAVLILGAFAVMIQYEPSEYRYEYSVVIDAPSSTIFSLINDLKEHEGWSPWIEKDPKAVLTYTATTTGEGASVRWKGQTIGEGSQQIVASIEDKEVKLKLLFKAPYEDEAEASWWLDEVDDGVMVTWSIWGNANFTRKAMDKIFDFEAMLGDDFNRGLRNIKKIAEQRASEDDDLLGEDAVMALDEDKVQEVLDMPLEAENSSTATTAPIDQE